jgi:hypothetical protein
MKLAKIVILALLAGFTLYLCEFLVREPGMDGKESNVPSLNVSRLEAISDKINQRQDVSTNAKPNISKFSFGDQEPF